MPKRTTFGVRSTISCLSQRGFSRRKIMSIVGVSRKVVDRWSVRDTQSDKPRNTLNLSNRKKGMIKRTMRQTKSLRDTGRKSGVSHSTVRKITRRSQWNRGGMYPYKEKSKLRISPKQLIQRREYCETLPKTNRGIINRIRKVIFYDEKPMCLGKGVNKQNNRIWSENPIDVWEQSRFKDQHLVTVHCFACISYNRKSKLKWYGLMTTYQRGRHRGK
jgi:transposase